MAKFFTTFLIVISTFALQAQDFGIKFSGFAKTDVFLNTRKSSEIREGHFYYYPTNISKDAEGNDKNEFLNFNMLSIQSRLTGKISAPDFLGAKTSGVIEFEFFGTSDADINGLRMRHAALDLDWGSTKLKIGQYWNPLFIEDAFPKVVAFNTGAPYQPFSRNPQIRLALLPSKNFEINLAAMSQRDFSSLGPNGGSSEYLRNSPLPIVNLGVKVRSSSVFFAANGQYKVIRPRISSATGAGYENTETVSGLIANALVKVSPSDDFYFTVHGLYGQNATDMLMLGGYVSTVLDASKGTEKYYPLNIISSWLDMQYGKNLAVGLFAGYSKNLGASEENINIIANYARGADIDQLLRISPRITYQEGKVMLAAELDYSQAAYGNQNITNGKVENTTNVSNIRLLLAAYLFF